MTILSALLASPLGPILIEGDERCLHRIIIGGERGGPEIERVDPASPTGRAAMQLRAYFDGACEMFDLPLAPAATHRGEALRQAIIAIPCGASLSYGEVARLAASSPRAIGQACARNPFPIVVPCHRVLGNGGAIGQYSAGHGVATKLWLLEHERRGGLL
ncbi:MAG: methylated-DNA--[protein]-cysteine S-methyltransferase [Rhizorhabdus sp.]|uniref:methylated-DNA--[protein]-cysteine S-methyltransferase n=1 Tax=Rhizorhabdus sp. TaxID=1968843 RepID=UPI001B7BBC8B|nr:methylated-DNA--[protein]-cysteine S-methyltransferase [Rhizorhabdus sp.]MBP8230683.1 methylated-DNA--[protein]-cysteine S-methyltransferase [Rhizorhabdus sp.]